jgi:hypothetical protein
MDRDDLTIFENVIRQIGEATGWPLPTPFPFRQRARVNPDLTGELGQPTIALRAPSAKMPTGSAIRLAATSFHFFSDSRFIDTESFSTFCRMILPDLNLTVAMAGMTKLLPG